MNTFDFELIKGPQFSKIIDLAKLGPVYIIENNLVNSFIKYRDYNNCTILWYLDIFMLKDYTKRIKDTLFLYHRNNKGYNAFEIMFNSTNEYEILDDIFKVIDTTNIRFQNLVYTNKKCLMLIKKYIKIVPFNFNFKHKKEKLLKHVNIIFGKDMRSIVEKFIR